MGFCRTSDWGNGNGKMCFLISAKIKILLIMMDGNDKNDKR